jgi:pyroglutamyl-peptidase
MSAPYRVLLTGFEPFGKHRANSSQRAVEQLRRRPPAGVELSTLVLPVAFEQAWERLRAHLDAMPGEARPHAIVLTGMAAKTRRVRLERLAVNIADAASCATRRRRPVPRPDDAGAAPADRPIVEGGPLALPARADVRRLARDLLGRGLAVEVSLSAGSYVCNDLYYRALEHLGRREGGPACLFVHLPELPRRRPVRVMGVAVPLLTRPARRAMPLAALVLTLAALVGELARRGSLAGA